MSYNYFFTIFLSFLASHGQIWTEGRSEQLLSTKIESTESDLESKAPQEPTDDDNVTLSFGVLTEHLRNLVREPPPNRIIPYNPVHKTRTPQSEPLPTHYNAADVYGDECPSFRHIGYQGTCSNCWAVSTISMINDRVCMYKKKGERQKFYSTKYLTTCRPKGCEGGWFSSALQYWISDGLVEGGDYRMHEPDGCLPYPPNTRELEKKQCERLCTDGTSVSRANRSHGGAQYLIRSGKAVDIMREIYLYGPVIATFDVYSDLGYDYRRGVYHKRSSKKLGGHAAKLYGWGMEYGVPFWYATNSWGKNWGDHGLFKIRRGNNECQIESNIHAAVPYDGLRLNGGRKGRKKKRRNLKTKGMNQKDWRGLFTSDQEH